MSFERLGPTSIKVLVSFISEEDCKNLANAFPTQANIIDEHSSEVKDSDEEKEPARKMIFAWSGPNVPSVQISKEECMRFADAFPEHEASITSYLKVAYLNSSNWINQEDHIKAVEMANTFFLQRKMTKEEDFDKFNQAFPLRQDVANKWLQKIYLDPIEEKYRENEPKAAHEIIERLPAFCVKVMLSTLVEDQCITLRDNYPMHALVIDNYMSETYPSIEKTPSEEEVEKCCEGKQPDKTAPSDESLEKINVNPSTLDILNDSSIKRILCFLPEESCKNFREAFPIYKATVDKHLQEVYQDPSIKDTTEEMIKVNTRSIENANALCIKSILYYLSEEECKMLRNILPMHKDTVNKYLKRAYPKSTAEKNPKKGNEDEPK